MSKIQALCDVTPIVNVISYTVDDMSYIVHVISWILSAVVIKGGYDIMYSAYDGIPMPPVMSYRVGLISSTQCLGWHRVDVTEVRMGFKLDIVIYRYRYIYIDSFPLLQEKLPDLCLQLDPEVMWDPGFCQPSACHNLTSSGSHSENGVPRSPMKASQGSYFPTDSPSSGVIVTGPQVTTCQPTCSCEEGVPPLKSHFHPHGDKGIWAA